MEKIQLDGSVPLQQSHTSSANHEIRDKSQEDKPDTSPGNDGSAVDAQGRYNDIDIDYDDASISDIMNIDNAQGDIIRDSSQELPRIPTSSGSQASYVESSQLAADRQHKRKIIRKIGQYKTLFAQELIEIDLRNLYMKSLAELIDLEETVEFHVSTRRSIKAAHNMFLGGLTVMELFAPRVGFDLKGLTNVAASSQDLLETVSECSIKYSENIQIDPLHRLGLHVVQLAIAVDSHNKAMTAKKEQENSDNSPGITSAIPSSSQIPETRPDNIQQAAQDNSKKSEKVTELMKGL